MVEDRMHDAHKTPFIGLYSNRCYTSTGERDSHKGSVQNIINCLDNAYTVSEYQFFY